MNIPYVFPVRGVTVPNLDFIPIEFQTVTSGNPTETRGNLIYSLTRGGAGIYTLVINGTWRSLLCVGSTAVNLGADANTAAYCTPTAITSSGGRTTIDLHVGLIAAAATDSDGSGNLEVHLLFAGMQQGTN